MDSEPEAWAARWTIRSGFVSKMHPRTCSKFATSSGRWLLRWQRSTPSASESPRSRWSAPFSSSRASFESSCARWRPTKPATPVMSVRKGLARPPVFQQVAKRGLERDRGLPAGRLLEFSGVPQQNRNVGGAHARGILLHLDLRLRHAQELVEHGADRPVAPGADVVDLPRL